MRHSAPTVRPPSCICILVVCFALCSNMILHSVDLSKMQGFILLSKDSQFSTAILLSCIVCCRAVSLYFIFYSTVNSFHILIADVLNWRQGDVGCGREIECWYCVANTQYTARLAVWDPDTCPGHILSDIPLPDNSPFLHRVGHPPFHHHHAPIINIKRSTVNVYRIDSDRLNWLRSGVRVSANFQQKIPASWDG